MQLFIKIKSLRTHFILGILCLSLAAFLSAYLVFASSPFDITFPVEELGNCVNQSQCKAYCDRTENFKACSEFAAKHGFAIKVEHEAIEGRIDKFVEVLESGGGPGGCKTEAECRVYCEEPANMESCLEFAENHNLIPSDELKEAKKVAKALRSGVKLPGGCRNKQACESYCSQPNHSEECLAFAEQSGILPKEEIGIAKKANELMSKGESPGGCQSRQACEAYCSDSSHQQECFDFGVKVGFIKPEQANEFRRFIQEGGPGGCKTKDACEAFCNDQANQETCFNFAKEHGFIKEEDAQRMKESMGHMRIGLENAPPEVAECLKANLGENIIEDIKAGRLTPGPDIGNRMRSCFETHMGRMASPKETFEHMPPEMLKCAEEKLGADFEKIRSGESVPTPEMGEKMRACFESMPHSRMPKPEEILKNAPPEAQACLKESLGNDFESFLSGNREFTSDLKDKMRSCFEKIMPFKGEGERGGFRPTEGGFREGTKEGEMMRFEGPGGCRTPQECMNYCVSHKEECMNFRPQGAGGMMPSGQEGMMQGGMMGEGRSMPGFGGPVGCPVEECRKEPGSAVCEQKVKELTVGNPGERFKYAGCFRGNTQPMPESQPIKRGGICPAMPTVDSCPEGQIKYQVYNSPECGAYYACKQQAGTSEQSSTRPEFCAQVITKACDPATGVCKEFPTPCDVPQGWRREYPEAVHSESGIAPQPYPGQTYPVPYSSSQYPSPEQYQQYQQQYQGTYPYKSSYPTQ